MKSFLKKLQTEKNKGINLTVKTYITYDEEKLIVQVIGPNRFIERSYPNNDFGLNKMKTFVSQFKTIRDIDKYLTK
jgi:hypothetical protein